MSFTASPARDSARKAAGFAADQIRRQILEGFLAPGQRLIESELMQRIPVGRSTLREAFVKLEGEGLVELQHQRGAVVRRMTRVAMAELFQVRASLEGLAAGLAAERVDVGANRSWLKEARQIWTDTEVLTNELTHMENNVPLHDGIIAMSGNARLASVLKPLDLPGYRLQFLRLLRTAEREVSARQHLEIIDAILAGKATHAEKLMRAHVHRAGELAQAIPGLV